MFFGCFFFFKQKTAYEISVRDWSSDVCSSDLSRRPAVCDGDALDRLREERGAEAPRVGETGARQRLGIERSVLGSEQRATTVVRRAGPALAHLVGPQPIAAQARLALRRHRVLEPVLGGFVERERGDPRLPQM